MCGIAGTWTQDGNRATQRMGGALERMRRRGPDDRGTESFPGAWGTVELGQTRLSVIDLSAGGHQPMHSEDGRYVMVFNGEIYNYVELRAELTRAGRRFQTQSDSEVLLAAWAHWGLKALPRLEGMFAFAVWDKHSAKLTCVRDAFGIKPLLFRCSEGRFVFASELVALMHLWGSPPQLNAQRVYDYLVFGDYDSKPESFIEGVQHLPPGTWLEVDLVGGKTTVPEAWWKPSIDEKSKLTFADASAELRERFLSSVRLQLRSDVLLGAALSGGIDSSAVVCAMRNLNPGADLHTFSFVASGSAVSEAQWIDQVNTHVAAKAHIVHVEAAELSQDLDDLIQSQGEPFGSTSIYAQYRVFKLARSSGMTVTLDGQGADELLAGYLGYPGQRFRSLVETEGLAAGLGFLAEWSRVPGRGALRGVRAVLSAYAGPHLQSALGRVSGVERHPQWLDMGMLKAVGVVPRLTSSAVQSAPIGRHLMAELRRASTTGGLQALLRHGDRNSMRFSVESRVPFLSHQLAEFVFSLPESFLISRQGETKSVFRAAMRGLVPDAILDRQDKIGFATPELDWMKALAPQARIWLREGSAVPFVKTAEMLACFDDMMNGRRRFTWQAWRWINFVRWHQTVFTDMSRSADDD